MITGERFPCNGERAVGFDVRAVPPLTAGCCQVWWADADSRLADRTSILNSDELRRAGSLRRAADRRRFVVGCVASRLVLASYLEMWPESVPIDRRCMRCGESHGRPRLYGDELAFSVSHSGNRVVVAFARRALVGIDIEELGASVRSHELISAVLAPSELDHLSGYPRAEVERPFLSYWTRKEAVAKATGVGLAVQLCGIVVSPPEEPAGLLAYAGRPGLADMTCLVELHPGAGYVATLALVGERRRWSIAELDAESLLR